MDHNRLTMGAICQASREVASGLVHANLGGGVYKQRVARAGQGKSGGFRTIVFFETAGNAFFILGFAKNERDNISPQELKALKELAREVLGYDEKAIDQAIKHGAFEELFCEEPAPQSDLRSHP
jgi:hypothetical protein